MSSAAKILVPLLLLAAAAGGAYYYLNHGDTPAVVPQAPDVVQVEQPQDPQEPTPQAESEQVVAEPQPMRSEATGAVGNAYADAPQGIKGRVLLPSGQPAVGVPVMLLQNAMANPIDMFLLNKTGATKPPLAQTVTLADGSFALGVRKVGKPVDLRVVSDNYPEFVRAPLTIERGDWYDAGDLVLEEGLLVQGRVVELVSRQPIVGATVFLSSSSTSHSMMATPGRERGSQVRTDANGFFRFTNGPRQGLINLAVEIPGYASAMLRNQQLKPGAPNEFTLELERGRTITGVVVDATGKRIAGAKVQARGLSAKTPQNETVLTDAAGEFEFPALRKGPYQLTVSAPRFTEQVVPLALTDEDIKVVMQSRGRVRLQVLGSDNRPVKTYRLSLKRYYPQNPDNIGNVFDFPDRNISPRDYRGDWAIIDGLPAGEFRFQLTERNHAKTLSPVFKVVEGASEDVEVVAVLTVGASITGTVIDFNGKPVAGAVVSTDMNAGIAANTGLFEIFRSMIPEKHSTKQVRTNKQGVFRITKLAFADYMVRVSHPAYCEGHVSDITLDHEGQVVDAGVIQLEAGCIVEGTTTVDGVPTGQIKVVLSVPPDPNGYQPTGGQQTPEQKAAAARMLFSTNVLSDGSGHFRMLKRVPPGTYKVTAARQEANNPFNQLIDMKQTERQVVIAPGQETLTINFALSSR
ncbi:MAG TPA: carboxypeptidase regulatory-like domain-containing protein [bacterium]|nr:carboxypeptidase regulatory-like domain-containing protein [bacterium]